MGETHENLWSIFENLWSIWNIFWSLLNETKGQFWICWRGHGEEKQELFPCHWLHLICIGLLLWLVEIPLLLTLKLLQGRLCIWSYSFWFDFLEFFETSEFFLFLILEFDFDNFSEILVPYIWSNSGSRYACGAGEPKWLHHLHSRERFLTCLLE